MSKVIFVSDNGEQYEENNLPEFCTITLRVANGKVVHGECNKSFKMQPTNKQERPLKNVSKTH